jgi:hypothetical protein
VHVVGRRYDRGMAQHYRFTANLWEWKSRASWFFVSLPEDAAAEIQALPMPPRGFGSIRVRAVIGGTTFETSIFPSEDTFVLPVKKAVRVRESLEPGEPVEVELEIVG